MRMLLGGPAQNVSILQGEWQSAFAVQSSADFVTCRATLWESGKLASTKVSIAGVSLGVLVGVHLQHHCCLHHCHSAHAPPHAFRMRLQMM